MPQQENISVKNSDSAKNEGDDIHNKTHYFIHHFVKNDDSSDTDFIGNIKTQTEAITKAKELKANGLSPSLHKVITDVKNRKLTYYFVDVETGKETLDEIKHLEEWE